MAWGHACLGGMCGQGVCMVRGHTWPGDMHGQGEGGMHATHTPPYTVRYGQSMSGWYASYWNAFLFSSVGLTVYYLVQLDLLYII